MKKMLFALKLSLILFFILNQKVLAQQKEKFLKSTLGLGIYKVQDQVVSPLIYAGPSTLLSIEKIKQSDKAISNIRLSYGNGKLKNKAQNTINHTIGKLYFSLLKPIGNNIYIGGASETSIAIRDFSVAKSFGLESLSGDVFSVINLAFLHQTKEKKWGKLQTKMEFSVAGLAFSRKMFTLVSNPELIVVDDKIGKSLLKTAELISLNQLKKVDLNLHYIKTLNEKHAIGLDLGLIFYQYERLYATTISQNTTLSIGYYLKLKN